MDNHNMDRWAHESLKDREIKPRPAVWDQLESKLNEELPKRKPGNHNKLLLLLGVLILSVTLFFLTTQNQGNSASQSAHSTAPLKVVETQQPASAPAVHKIEELSNTQNLMEKQKSIPQKSKSINPYLSKPLPTLPAPNDAPVGKETESIKAAETRTNKEVIFASVITPEEKPNLSGDIGLTTPTNETEKVVSKSKRYQVDADKLLAEVTKEMAQTRTRYHIDPKKLLAEAEKENSVRFLDKVIKTVSERSTVMYAAVATRNVEP